MEKNDEKLKRILSEKVGALKKIEESPQLSKDLDSKKSQKSFHEENKNQENMIIHENSKENPMESPEIRKIQKHNTEGHFSSEIDDKNDKNISFSERKHRINNFNLNFNDVPTENHDENEKNQEEEIKEYEGESGREGKNENDIETPQEQIIQNKNSTENIQNNENQDNNKTCLICFDRDSDAVIMDCGHGGDFVNFIN